MGIELYLVLLFFFLEKGTYIFCVFILCIGGGKKLGRCLVGHTIQCNDYYNDFLLNIVVSGLATVFWSI